MAAAMNAHGETAMPSAFVTATSIDAGLTAASADAVELLTVVRWRSMCSPTAGAPCPAAKRSHVSAQSCVSPRMAATNLMSALAGAEDGWRCRTSLFVSALVILACVPSATGISARTQGPQPTCSYAARPWARGGRSFTPVEESRTKKATKAAQGGRTFHLSVAGQVAWAAGGERRQPNLSPC